MANDDVRVAVALVVFLQIAASIKDLGITHRAARLKFTFLGQLLIRKNGISNEPNAVDLIARKDIRDHPNVISDRLREETDVIDNAGFEEAFDIVVQALGAVFGPSLGGHQVAQTRFVHGFCSTVTDGDFRNVFSLEILCMDLAGKCRDEKAGNEGDATQEPFTARERRVGRSHDRYGVAPIKPGASLPVKVNRCREHFRETPPLPTSKTRVFAKI